MGGWEFDLIRGSLSWSEEIRHIFGLAQEQQGGEPPDFARIIHPEDRGRLDLAYRASIANRKSYEIDYRLCLPGNRVKHVRERCKTLYSADGEAWISMGTVLNLTEIKEAQRMLEHSQAELGSLLARRMEVLEDIRRLLSHEMHEDLGQLLVALRLKVSRLRRAWIELGPEADAISQDMLDMLGQAIRKIRELVASIRPAALKMGAIATLEWLAEDFSSVTRIPCHFHAPEAIPPLDDRQITTLFRLTQEALTNIALHAEASRVDITLEHDGEHGLLSVTDDGTGLPPEDDRKAGLGLIAMREQALLLGGELRCAPLPEAAGTVVSLRFPLKEHSLGKGSEHE
ncbi:MAG: PAS domain-containing protein [Pseudomonadota bacterium]